MPSVALDKRRALCMRRPCVPQHRENTHIRGHLCGVARMELTTAVRHTCTRPNTRPPSATACAGHPPVHPPGCHRLRRGSATAAARPLHLRAFQHSGAFAKHAWRPRALDAAVHSIWRWPQYVAVTGIQEPSWIASNLAGTHVLRRRPIGHRALTGPYSATEQLVCALRRPRPSPHLSAAQHHHQQNGGGLSGRQLLRRPQHDRVRHPGVDQFVG